MKKKRPVPPLGPTGSRPAYPPPAGKEAPGTLPKTYASIFIKYKDFTVAQKQTSLDQPTDVTAVILNEARMMLGEIWDGTTPIRQVGLGVSKLTHESAIQMSLFEDPKLEYYREWDRQYDEEKAKAEDARMLAYERKTSDYTLAATAPLFSSPTGNPTPPPTVAPPERFDIYVRRRRKGSDCCEESNQRASHVSFSPYHIARRDGLL